MNGLPTMDQSVLLDQSHILELLSMCMPLEYSLLPFVHDKESINGMDMSFKKTTQHKLLGWRR
jgi:hypothetical protein